MADVHDRSSGWIGAVLADKWRIDAKIARGGVATVYRATHRQGQVAAIKIMHPELARNEEVRRRFLREGYAANKVGHPGVVSVLDDDVTADGSAYIVMELLEQGEVLEDRRERLGGKLPVAEAVDVCAQILDVLAVAHGKGIIHRDIKPENIFVLTDGTVKVLDFGIAHIKEAVEEHEATKTGLLLGTPEYMSPEQVLGKRGQIDASTDIYAVGATLFTLLSGESVHVAETLNMLLVQASSRQARSLSSVVYKELPRPLIAVVDKALALEKPRRWPSARAMQLALREAVPAKARDASASAGANAGKADANANAGVGKADAVTRPNPPSSAAPVTVPSLELDNDATQRKAPSIARAAIARRPPGLPSASIAPKAPSVSRASAAPPAPRLSAPPPRPASLPPPAQRPASLAPPAQRPASLAPPPPPRASVSAQPLPAKEAPTAIDGPASVPTLSAAPAMVPNHAKPPPSLAPLSGPTTVIPRREESDPWTDEMGADDLDGPTVATTGPIGGSPTPSVRSEVLARSGPASSPRPPSAPHDPMESTQLLRTDEREALVQARTVLDPASTPARVSAPPPPPRPSSSATPSYVPPPPPRDAAGRSIAPPAVPAAPLPSMPPPAAPPQWTPPRGYAMPMMNGPLPQPPPAPGPRQPLTPGVIVAITIGALLLGALWIGSCLMLRSS